MLYIPSEITVGFKKMKDSFTGKKGFITYKELGNKSDKLFNQSKFDSFIDNEKDNIKINNVPMNGFVINKKMTHEHNYFGQYSTILVYHPDGFEFEISLSNLMTIMEYSDINAQEIKQKCVLGWYKSYPVLMPISCPLYNEAQEQNAELLEIKDMSKDLVIGRKYYSKTEKNLIYIGRENINKLQSYNEPQNMKTRQGHIFLKDDRNFVSLAKCQAAYSSEIHPDISFFQEMYKFQQEQVKLIPNQVKHIKFKLSKSDSNIFLNSLTEFFTNDEDEDSNSPLTDYDKKNFYFSCKNIFNEISKFDFYSSKLNDIFHFEFVFNEKTNFIDLSFTTSTILAKAFRNNADFQATYRQDKSVKNDVLKKLKEEFNVDSLLVDINSILSSYLRNKKIDIKALHSRIEEFRSQFEWTGFQYSESEGFEYGVVFSHTHYLSDYKSKCPDIDGTNAFYYDIYHKTLLGGNSMVFEKVNAEVIKLIPY